MNDGRVFIAGGDGENSAEIYDPAAGNFSEAGSMEEARSHALLRVLPDGKVQIIGGNGNRSVEIYDPSDAVFGAYAQVPPEGDEHAGLITEIMSSATRSALLNSGQTVTELEGQALAAGGTDVYGTPTDAFTIYTSSAASVTTNVLDYPPGTPVIISGSGFGANEMVDLTLHEFPHVNSENPHVFTVQADADGNFVFDQYAPEEEDLGITYILGAKGETSGRTAQTTFHDATQTNTVITSSSNPSTVGQSVMFTATVRNGNTTGSGTLVTVGNVDFGTGLNCSGGFRRSQAGLAFPWWQAWRLSAIHFQLQ